MVIMLMGSKMSLQIINAVGQQGNLYLGGAGIGGTTLKIPHNLRFLFSVQRHSKRTPVVSIS
jgi:hypothetical protein